jgi:phosphoglycolate phosphatase-like HAD superfamily hydrolase
MLPQNYNPKEFEEIIYQKWIQKNLGKPESQGIHQTKYIIFDFDGVLSDSLESELYALQKVQKYSNRQEAYIALQEIFLKPPVKDFKDKIEVEKSITRIKKICEYKIAHGFGLFSGFIYELKKLTNVKFAINTTADNTNINYIKESLSDLDFDQILTLDDGLDKAEKNRKIMENWKADAKDVYFITDTVRDFLEVKNQFPKENILATSWGWHDKKNLETVFDSSQILNEYSDIHKFFKTHCILMPPPNLTGNMHAGHSFQHFLMDTLSRINRQEGKLNLWYPGVDHAGIQLEGVIDKMIRKGDFDDQIFSK